MKQKRTLNKEEKTYQQYHHQKKYQNPSKQIIKKKHIDEYKPSGNLYKRMKQKDGRIIDYCEPIDSCIPSDKWRIYIFEGDNELKDPYLLYDKPFYLFGQDAKQVDFLLSHSSIDNQRAIIQFRKQRNKIAKTEKIVPYIIDLHSHEGTLLNGKKINADVYIELLSGDQLSFGKSSLSYLVVNESYHLNQL